MLIELYMMLEKGKEYIQLQIYESQRENFIYQQRLEALSVEATKKKEMEENKRKLEEVKHDLEEKKHELEEAKQREAHERQEKERFLALLRKAGIDPEAEPR